MASSVPKVIPAFKALAASALPSGSQIVFATVLPRWQAKPGDVATIGSGATLQITGIHFTQDAPGELGPLYRHEEHYSILCSLCAWAGDWDFDSRLQDAYTLYSDLSIAISSNPTLGLTTPKPRLAWPRQLDVSPGPDAFGRSGVTITFEVQVQARVESLT